MSLAFKAVFSKRPIYTAPYFFVGAELRPRRPKICIFFTAGGPDCKITNKGKRDRKIGLEHPLILFGCCTHVVFFPVYPLGWVHYGRRPLVELGPDGSEIDRDADFAEPDAEIEDDGAGAGVETSTDSGAEAGAEAGEWWRDTAFGAAIDAKNGLQWPLTALGIVTAPEPKPYGVFKTQRRHIAGILRLFRIDAESNDKARERVVARLPVGISSLNTSAARVRDGPREELWQRDGGEGTAITKKLTPPKRWLKNILELGAAVNFWGSPVYD